jgi:glycosyltransferase involved in cell wall biosynthesis
VLKVLQLIPTLDRSGAEKQMVLLAKGLPRDRFQVEVATLTRLGPLEADLTAAGIPIRTIAKRFKFDPFAVHRLARLLKTSEFDVVHTWIFAANTYGRVACRIAGVPIVVVAEMAVDLWKGRLEKTIDRSLTLWCDRLVGNSDAVVEFYHRQGVPTDRLAMIYSGTEDDEPPAVNPAEVRAEFGFESTAPLVLFAGRLAEQKRVIDLLKALDLLQHVQPDVRTLIVGTGPLLEQLVETAHTYHLTERVRFLGHRNDVPRLLAVADVLVLTSAYEGLPNVVLEAMRFRKPVVATAAPGTTEAVINGQTGILVPIGNVKLLARAIRDVLRDRGLATRLGTAGRSYVEAQFRVDTMVARYADLYETLASSKGINRR